MMDVEAIRTFSLGVAAAGATIFFVTYMFRPWRLHRVGRALLIQSAALALALDLGLLYRLRPDIPGDSGTKAFTFTLLAVAIWLNYFVMVRQGAENENAPKPYSDPDQPESWYWIEYRPSGHWVALEPPADCTWLLVRDDLELEWFQDVGDAAEALNGMIEKDLSVVSARKRQGGKL